MSNGYNDNSDDDDDESGTNADTVHVRGIK